jgi:hypothetical protein
VVNVRYSVLARDETLPPKVAAACATQPLASRPIQQNVLVSQDANDHAGRAGLDGEAGAKWSLSEDHVSAVEWHLAGLRCAWQSCVLLLTSSPSIWWRVARPDTHRLHRRTISLVRLARLVESRYTCWGCYHRVLYLPHTAIVRSCIEAKSSSIIAICSSVYHVDINAACRTPRAG